MSVKINGLKYLDSNRYDEIMIREKNGFMVEIKSKNLEFNELLVLQKFQGEHVSAKFSTQLKDKTDEEKIKEIIKKYLEYSTIYEIADIYHLPHYDGWFSKISGTRNLYLQILNPNFKDICQIIIKKYINDRLKFCAKNNEINKIRINCIMNSSYSLKDGRINFNLMKNENKIVEIEKEFFKEFISNKLNQVNEIAYLSHNCLTIDDGIKTEMYGTICLYFANNDLDIEIQGNIELFEILEELVRNHNNELQKNKVMQLKMQGF